MYYEDETSRRKKVETGYSSNRPPKQKPATASTAETVVKT
jgi:hypothetical protein